MNAGIQKDDIPVDRVDSLLYEQKATPLPPLISSLASDADAGAWPFRGAAGDGLQGLYCTVETGKALHLLVTNYTLLISPHLSPHDPNATPLLPSPRSIHTCMRLSGPCIFCPLFLAYPQVLPSHRRVDRRGGLLEVVSYSVSAQGVGEILSVALFPCSMFH